VKISSLRNFGLALLWISISGCSGTSFIMGSTFHQKFGWKAEDYFDDPKVIDLCHAIESNDLVEIDRQIAAGANVNAQGKDHMTPLLWAFPDNKLERFTKLLEHGADPNVVIKSDLNTHGGFHPGDSVTHMACKTEFPGYFEAVFAHGGDPNLIRKGTIPGDTPLFSVTNGAGPSKNEHIKLLMDKGADLNHMNGAWATPAMEAVSCAQYGIALTILQGGADYNIYVPKSNTRLVHIVVGEERRKPFWTSQQAADYEKLVKWLEDHGESIEQARADNKRWQSWMTTPVEFRRKMDAEIAEREAREAREKAAAQKPEPKQ
jgi:uncharacterized protein